MDESYKSVSNAGRPESGCNTDGMYLSQKPGNTLSTPGFAELKVDKESKNSFFSFSDGDSNFFAVVGVSSSAV